MQERFAGQATRLIWATARARNMNGEIERENAQSSKAQRQRIAKIGNVPAFSRYPIQVMPS